ncbi:hypothetical protein Pan181_44430 [Aeoliella mucimassa]|uniref:Putative restriction endonuclease domain-containing protein n=2 Tax=Aeoliella mucimassa TaxID=2527972 RepID=A0A518AU05_9BACT|nr:hypothetical protein Pan181_44430 [Aeoliella mucimassa]
MSLAQFRNWAESEAYPKQGKVVYYRGELFFDMSPERIDSHSALKQTLNLVIGGLVQQRDLGRYYPDGAGIQNEAAAVANEPDAFFAKWATIKSGKLAAPPEKQGKHTALVGAPDWVCEIVSDSSEEKDLEILRRAYHAAGIPEYWILDARNEEIRFLLLTWTENEYAMVESVDNWYRSSVFDIDFQLTRQIDQVGWWQYELKYR